MMCMYPKVSTNKSLYEFIYTTLQSPIQIAKRVNVHDQQKVNTNECGKVRQKIRGVVRNVQLGDSILFQQKCLVMEQQLVLWGLGIACLISGFGGLKQRVWSV
jgi:hypothetical protein